MFGKLTLVNEYTYKDNKQNGKILFVVLTSNILEADKLFEEATGINPMKASWIGLTIEKPTLDN